MIVILQAVFVIGAVVPASNKSFGTKHPITLFARVAALVASVLAVIWVILVGHEGASQSWGFV